MKIGRRKSRGVESALWATIPPISCDRMAKISSANWTLDDRDLNTLDDRDLITIISYISL